MTAGCFVNVHPERKLLWPLPCCYRVIHPVRASGIRVAAYFFSRSNRKLLGEPIKRGFRLGHRPALFHGEHGNSVHVHLFFACLFFEDTDEALHFLTFRRHR